MDNSANLTDKFLSERELKVDYISINDDPNKSARNWFDAIESELKKLPIYTHTNMGSPADTASDNNNVWFFRGQENALWGLHSTLYRACTTDTKNNQRILPETIERKMRAIEDEIIATSRKNGIGRGLTALELLTLLQHHGSPTRLIDITSDWQVALYFACEGSEDVDGRIFLIKTNFHRWDEFPKANKDPESTLAWYIYKTDSRFKGIVSNYGWHSGVWPILLPFSDPRMIAQHGFFLVGGVPSLQGKAFLNTSECKTCKKKLCECKNQEPDYGNKEEELTAEEFRNVTSLSIGFKARPSKFSEAVEKVPLNKWTALGFTLRVPAEYKREVRTILQERKISRDSIYPPLNETRRLLKALAAK